MKFHVGPFTYTLVVSDRSIFDADGNQLDGIAVESRRMLLISRHVEPERREEVAMHEFVHAWEFHVPKPTTDEERCQFFAFLDRQFRDDLHNGGGRETLAQIVPRHVNHIDRPLHQAAKVAAAREIVSFEAQRVCGQCDTSIVCGSIHNGEPTAHEATGKFRLERWMRCDVCGTVTVWQEVCTSDGSPLLEFVSYPAPRMIRGAEAALWAAERATVLV